MNGQDDSGGLQSVHLDFHVSDLGEEAQMDSRALWVKGSVDLQRRTHYK